jgi:hypothetical protein
MPANMVQTIVDKCQYSQSDAEDMWSEAKKAAKKSGVGEDSDRFYQVTVGILKNMLSEGCLKKLGWQKGKTKEVVETKASLVLKRLNEI